MTTATKNKLVPELRFKEFEGDFTLSKLGNELNLFNGYAFSSKDSSDSGVRWVKIADVGINKMKLDNPSFLPSEFVKKYSKFLLHKGDYVVALTRPILRGKLKIAKINEAFEGSLLNQRVGKLVSKNNLEFIYCMLQQKSLISRIQNRIAGTDPPNLSPSEISTLKTYIPSLPEQEKIASFLSAVDEKIQQLTQKKELLEQYKKGVMQQLFSGKLRFKDEKGKDYPHWEEKRLGEVGKTFNGLTGKTKVDFGTGVPYIQYMQIFKGSKINPNEFGFVKLNENEKQNKAKYGDAFFTTSSETPKEIGTASVLLDKIEDLYLNSFCFGFRPNNLDKLVPQFLQFFLRSEVFRRKIIPLAQGSTRYNMSKVQLMKLSIAIPYSEEQQKIATFLSGIDAKIESVANQITQTQTFKKGLLQKMFV